MNRNIVRCFIFLSLTFQSLCAHELRDVASGQYHSLLLFEDGKILPYGDNFYGELGLPKAIDKQSITEENPLYIDSPVKFISVAVGFDFSLAVAEDGSLWGWGNNENYQFGLNKPKQIEKIQLLSETKEWKKVFAGGREALALKEDGSLYDLHDFEIIKNPNGVTWKNVNIFAEPWGFDDYTSVVILQDITDTFWVYGTCIGSLDNISIMNAFIDKKSTFDTVLPIDISSDTIDFKATELSGFYKNRFDTVIFGLSVADIEDMIKRRGIKESVYNYDYLSGVTVSEKSKKIQKVVIGDFSGIATFCIDIFQKTHNIHYFSYTALLKKNRQLVIYTNGKKMMSDKKYKIKNIFGGYNIFVQTEDNKIYGIGYFYPENNNAMPNTFSYFLPINY